jgi:hypothetical protein
MNKIHTQHISRSDPLIKVLSTFRRTDTISFDDAWVGMEPTFQSAKSVKKWRNMSEQEGGEDAYFLDAYMLGTQKTVAESIVNRYRRKKKKGDPGCLFLNVEREKGLDSWKVQRQNLHFSWGEEGLEDFEVRFTIDPETFEYSIKPVPLLWFYDERFVRFLQEFLWQVPIKLGLSPSIAHGGAQFSLSAKTYMTGSLLADDIADKLNHPELSTWILDWPNPDDRSFRATEQRFGAFQKMLTAYWSGGFHPKVKRALTVHHAFFDHGFSPVPTDKKNLMDPKTGPVGNDQQVFQTNFCFGRAVRLFAQNVHPGYWQAVDPKEDGYRPDQIMRYGEANVNRLQIAGEWHVKSGEPVDVERAPQLDALLDSSMLTTEASWENRGQMGRTSAKDFVEALLLTANRARYLKANPHVRVRGSLLQDQLLVHGETTVKKYAGIIALDKLKAKAREVNLEYSKQRLKTDWIEPEALFWAAWHALPRKEKAAIAREVIGRFVSYVEDAASMDPRPKQEDPMEWHRHRIPPVLWKALEDDKSNLKAGDSVRRELDAFGANRKQYLERRPVFSQIREKPPW